MLSAMPGRSTTVPERDSAFLVAPIMLFLRRRSSSVCRPRLLSGRARPGATLSLHLWLRPGTYRLPTASCLLPEIPSTRCSTCSLQYPRADIAPRYHRHRAMPSRTMRIFSSCHDPWIMECRSCGFAETDPPLCRSLRHSYGYAAQASSRGRIGSGKQNASIPPEGFSGRRRMPRSRVHATSSRLRKVFSSNCSLSIRWCATMPLAPNAPLRSRSIRLAA